MFDETSKLLWILHFLYVSCLQARIEKNKTINISSTTTKTYQEEVLRAFLEKAKQTSLLHQESLHSKNDSYLFSCTIHHALD